MENPLPPRRPRRESTGALHRRALAGKASRERRKCASMNIKLKKARNLPSPLTKRLVNSGTLR